MSVSSSQARRRIKQLEAELDGIRTEKSTPAKTPWPKAAVAAVASAVTLIATVIGVWVAWDGTHFSAEEERARQVREKRAQVYADYLAAARAVMSAATALANITYSKAPVPVGMQPKAVQTLSAAEAAWDKQADLVYVYGSDDAVYQTFEIRQILAPNGLVTDLIYNDGSHATQMRIDSYQMKKQRAWEYAERNFKTLFCREVPAEPRTNC